MTPTLNDALPILISGAVVPLLTALMVRPGWTAERKRLTSGAIAVVLAVVTAVATGLIQPPVGADWPVWRAIVHALEWLIPSIAVVIAVSQSVYRQLKGVWDRVAEATSPAPAREV